MSTDCGIFTIQKSVVLSTLNWMGTSSADGRMRETDQRERPRRVVAVLTVEVPTDDGQERECEDPRQAEDQAAVEHVVDVEVVVEVQRLQRGLAEEPEAGAQKATSTVRMVRMRLIRANAASIEIGAGCTSSMSSPSTSASRTGRAAARA